MSVTSCPDCREAPLPEAAQFCPSCGHALVEGARRARPARASALLSFVDSSWDFFASVKVAAVLIFLIALASIAGTLVEQADLYQDWRPPYLYYPWRYGPTLGPLYMKLGLTNAYTSLWYQVLILLCVISLIICSLHRLIPLHRVLTNPQVWKLPHFIRRQQVTGEVEATLEEVEAKLKRRGYRIIRDRECIYGDKGRIGRYGPYIIHIGLLIVAFAAYAKSFPGWDETINVWVGDGETVQVEKAGFAIQSHGFEMDTYINGMPSMFRSDLSILQAGQEVHRDATLVNHPLKYGEWEVFQSSFRQEMGIASLDLYVQGVNEPLKTIAMDLKEPLEEYPITDTLAIRVLEYYHDFTVDPNTKEPTNGSYEVKNPVMLIEFQESGRPIGRQALVVTGDGPSPADGPLELKVENVSDRWYTGLKVRKDKTVPWMFGGLGFMMLGMYVTFFMFHWQVWARYEEGKVQVGARAHKNKFGLTQEMRKLLGIPAETTEEANET